MNLFLGYFIPKENQPRLWELTTDYFLHNPDPRQRLPIQSYKKWWSTERKNAQTTKEKSFNFGQSLQSLFSEYYQPRQLTSFSHLFAFDMMSTLTRYFFFKKKFVKSRN